MYYNGQMNTDEAVRRLTEVVRRKHLALATERTYCAWLRRYCDFLKGLPLHLPSEHKLERFLTVLAQKDVAASTQNQAFNAIISKVPRRPQGRRLRLSILQFHPGKVQLRAVRIIFMKYLTIQLTDRRPPGASELAAEVPGGGSVPRLVRRHPPGSRSLSNWLRARPCVEVCRDEV